MMPDHDLLNEVDALSAHTLARRGDLALFLALARTAEILQSLDDLGFHAKVVHRTASIVKRLGPEGQGVTQVRAEFSRSLEMVRSLMTGLLPALPKSEADRIRREYLSMTQESLSNLMELCSDLRWYKNWLIDNKSTGRTA
jgi:hypothetical protein